MKSQVVNWTTNVRKRNLKATVEKGKKPHHFLDFLFLANDRDQKSLQGNQSVATSNNTEKPSVQKKKVKKASKKSQKTIKKTRQTNGKGRKNQSFPDPASVQHTSIPGHLNPNWNPATPVNTMMQQYSTPLFSAPLSHRFPMQYSFVPYFHPGAYTATRQITPPRFQFGEANVMKIKSEKAVNPNYTENEISPIVFNDIHKDDWSLAMEIDVDTDFEKDDEKEAINTLTQEALVSTPPRCEVDDMIWDFELESDVSMKDVFRDNNSERVSHGCDISMDEDDLEQKNDFTTEDDVLKLFSSDGDLDMLKIEDV